MSDEWINKMGTCTHGILLSHEKNEMMPSAATWMDLEILILSEISQRKANIMWYHLHVESIKRIQMDLLTKEEYTLRHRKHTSGYQKKGGTDGFQGFCVNTHMLLYIKEITKNDLLSSMENYTRHLVITYHGREYKK